MSAWNRDSFDFQFNLFKVIFWIMFVVVGLCILGVFAFQGYMYYQVYKNGALNVAGKVLNGWESTNQAQIPGLNVQIQIGGTNK